MQLRSTALLQTIYGYQYTKAVKQKHPDLAMELSQGSQVAALLLADQVYDIDRPVAVCVAITASYLDRSMVQSPRAKLALSSFCNV